MIVISIKHIRHKLVNLTTSFQHSNRKIIVQLSYLLACLEFNMLEQNMILVIQLISCYHILSCFDKHTTSTTLKDAHNKTQYVSYC